MSETIGHYKNLQKLGSAGSGEVFLAEDPVRGRNVVLKVFPYRKVHIPLETQPPAGFTIQEIGETGDCRGFIVMDHSSVPTSARDLEKVGERRRGSVMAPAFAVLIAVALIFASVEYRNGRRNAIPESPSIVILPAKVEGAPDFLSSAVSNTLSVQMTGLAGIETKTPPTNGEVVVVSGDHRRVAQAYGVNLVVETGITAAADQFQLNLQVIEPKTRNILWSGAFTGSRSQYLEMIQRAAEGLREKLRPGSAAATPLDVPGGPEAELAFREGEYHLDRYNSLHEPEDFDASLKAFQHALELDPKLANAAADISRLYGMRVEAMGQDPAVISEVENWAHRAIEIDAKCGRAYFMLSLAESWRAGSDPFKRLDNALRAAAFAPEFAPAHLDLAQAMAASANLGLAASRQSRQLDPLYLYAPLAEAGYLHQMGRTSEAFSMLDRHVVSIDPDLSYGRWAEASLMIELGWLEKAQPIIRDLEKDVSPERRAPLASNAIRQKFAIAQKQFGSDGYTIYRIMDVVNKPDVTPLEMSVAVELVPTLARGSYVEESLQILTRALGVGVVLPYDWLQSDKRLDRLRPDVQFTRTLERSRIRFDEMLKILDAAQSRGELPLYLAQPLAELRSQVR